MTLHQLTHTVAFEIDLGIAAALRRVMVRAVGVLRGWSEQRRLDMEMAGLDHRERADLAFRR